MADQFLDCRGQQCPKPIIQLSRAMAQLRAGQTVRVEATDPAFRADLDAWLEIRGGKLLDLWPDGDATVAVLEKC